MCEKCGEIDGKISHYMWIKSRLVDPKTLKAIDDLIAKLEAEKRVLHPDQE
jgi:hypothetical protein